MAIDYEFYNQASAAKLGWEPTWFNCDAFDDKLTRVVKKWQKSMGLKADGLVGPMTFRRLWTERESKIDKFQPKSCKYSDHIVHNGDFYPIEWDKVVLWSEEGGLSAGPGTYYDLSGKKDRKPTMFVNHWDVCLSSKSCERVLQKRGISVHFCIDNDGTIYQLLDTQHGAWHGSNRKVNMASIGVEISNAYYTKYQDSYVRRGFGERPVHENLTVHGREMGSFLGFYDVQLSALRSLWKAVHNAHGIEYLAPIDNNGNTSLTVDSSVRAAKFNGFVSHYHITSGKIDCACLDIVEELKKIK